MGPRGLGQDSAVSGQSWVGAKGIGTKLGGRQRYRDKVGWAPLARALTLRAFCALPGRQYALVTLIQGPELVGVSCASKLPRYASKLENCSM